MRKLLIFLITILLALTTWVSWSVHDLARSTETVTYTENVLYGDPTFAQGLEVTKYIQFMNHLLWTSQIKFQEGAFQSETDVRFSKDYLSDHFYQSKERAWQGLSMNTSYDSIVSLDSTDEQEDTNSIWHAFSRTLEAESKKLAQETPPGKRKESTIHIADYLDYYPFVFEINAENLAFSYSPYLDTGEDDSYGKAGRALQEYFKIPVLPDEYYTIGVEMGKDGAVYEDYEGVLDQGDCYNGYTESAISDDACYFWLNNRTENGQYVDTSLLPDGYGIYCLPYGYRKGHQAEEGKELFTEQLSLFYPMQEKDRLLEMHMSKDQQTLIIYTEEDGICYANFLTLADRQLSQRVSLGAYNSDKDYYYTETGEDYQVFNLSGSLFVFHETPDPSKEKMDWRLDFVTQAKNIEKTDDYLPFYGNFGRVSLYDGEKLVLCGTNITNKQEEDLWVDACGFYLAIYNEEGLQYYGTYDSSIDLANEKVTADHYDPGRLAQTIYWNGNELK